MRLYNMGVMMKQKSRCRCVFRIAAAVLMLCAVFAVMPAAGSCVHAASSKVKFASSIKKAVVKKAKKAGATAKSSIAVTKVTNYTNVYKKASIYSAEVGRLYKGTGAYVIKKGKTLSYISSGSVKGWVKNKCLMTGSAAEKYITKAAPQVATLKKYKALNVRVKPTASSEAVSYMKNGESLVVEKVHGDWLQVRLVNFSMKLPKANDYKYGYIYRKYVKLEKGLCSGVTVSAEEKLKKRIGSNPDGVESPDKETPSSEESTAKEEMPADTTTPAVNPDGFVTYSYVKAAEVEDIENSSTYKKVQSHCKWTGTVLNRSNGRIQGPNGEETYYNDGTYESLVRNMKNRGHVAETDRTWVRSDGVRMLGNYVMVAADINRTNIGHVGLRPLGTIYETSLGLAIVCDTGGFALKNPTQTDIYVAW